MMAKFKTSAALKDGYYGKRYYDPNKKKEIFEPLGKQVTVEEIIDNVETQCTSLQLSFEHRDGSIKRVTLPKKLIGDGSIITELADVGADVTKRDLHVFVDSLRLQEEEIELSGRGIRREYSHLGWINLPVTDDTGKTVGYKCCYRASSLIGHVNATYTGDYYVKPMGAWEIWRQMVLDEVLGRPLLEVLLVGGLSAVVNGLLAPATTGENPLIHVFGPSSSGKSTCGKLLSSTQGLGFSGQRTIIGANGMRMSKKSLFRSWGGTETSIIGGCAGNRGAVIVLNELGKLPANVNLTALLYNLSEAGDKDRGNEYFKIPQTEAYYSTLISLGEFSILDKVDTKDEGLRNRVLEITAQKFTDDANHARRINDVCNANNGHAAPILAKHIMDQGGLSYALEIYEKHRSELTSKMPDTPAKDRFHEKFVALFLATAEIASAALDIPFNIEEIYSWFYEYEKENGKHRNTSRDSYYDVVEECHIHAANFYHEENVPRGEVWGAIKRFNYKQQDCKYLVEEILIRRRVLADILRKYQYQNMKHCLDEWHNAGLLSRDADKPTRSRVIVPNTDKEDVYVLRVFSDTSPVNKPKSKLLAAAKGSQIHNLLSVDDEEDSDNA